MTCSLILVIRQKFRSPRMTGWPLMSNADVKCYRWTWWYYNITIHNECGHRVWRTSNQNSIIGGSSCFKWCNHNGSSTQVLNQRVATPLFLCGKVRKLTYWILLLMNIYEAAHLVSFADFAVIVAFYNLYVVFSLCGYRIGPYHLRAGKFIKFFSKTTKNHGNNK